MVKIYHGWKSATYVSDLGNIMLTRQSNNVVCSQAIRRYFSTKALHISNSTKYTIATRVFIYSTSNEVKINARVYL